MNEHLELRGLLAFVVTPTASDESIDAEALLRHVDDLIAAGVDGIVLFGSTGAIGSFTEAERMRLVEHVVPHVARRVPVAVGTGAITTAEAVRLSRHAQGVGADACLVVPITYWPLEEHEICAHYAAIAASIEIPICLYNSPILSGVDLRPDVIAKLARLGGVKYLKESSQDILRISQVKRATGEKLRIFWGRDNSALEGLLLGAEGWASAVANVIPRACRRLFDLVAARDLTAARELSALMAPLVEFLFQKNLASSCQAALGLLGKSMGPPRPPILPLRREELDHLQTLLRSFDDRSLL